MKLIIESTTKVVRLVIADGGIGDGGFIDARIWEGQTDTGIPVHCFITRVAVSTDEGLDHSQFERELAEQRQPSAKVDAAIPMRMIL